MSRSKNALITLACGDAYGNAYEMEGLFGATFDKKTLPDVAKIKRYTDDTKMAIILWKHYSEYGTIMPETLLAAYVKWAKEEGAADGIGIHTAAVLLRGERNKDSQGNGALMRILPFGLRLVEEGLGFEDAVTLMEIDAALTHDNEVVHVANRLCLSIAMNGIEVMQQPRYKPLLASLKPGYSAWVIHTLYHLLDVLQMNLSVLDGFKELVSRGGDTDTNCAIYGAIRGYGKQLEINVDDFLEPEEAEKVLGL